METEITVSSIRSVVFAVVRFLSVRLSVTFVYCIETSKRLLKLISLSGIDISRDRPTPARIRGLAVFADAWL